MSSRINVPGQDQLYTDGKGFRWRVDRLISLAQELIPFQHPLSSLQELDCDVWERLPTIREVSAHCKRINDADMSFPLILSKEGHIMDGCHRLAKAFMRGDDTILAVQFTEDPDPDF
jgi:hypothetical protein